MVAALCCGGGSGIAIDRRNLLARPPPYGHGDGRREAGSDARRLAGPAAGRPDPVPGGHFGRALRLGNDPVQEQTRCPAARPTRSPVWHHALCCRVVLYFSRPADAGLVSAIFPLDSSW